MRARAEIPGKDQRKDELARDEGANQARNPRPASLPGPRPQPPHQPDARGLVATEGQREQSADDPGQLAELPNGPVEPEDAQDIHDQARHPTKAERDRRRLSLERHDQRNERHERAWPDVGAREAEEIEHARRDRKRICDPHADDRRSDRTQRPDLPLDWFDAHDPFNNRKSPEANGNLSPHPRAIVASPIYAAITSAL